MCRVPVLSTSSGISVILIRYPTKSMTPTTSSMSPRSLTEAFLANVISKPVATLLQATDARRFQPAPAGSACTAMANEILFVGNSRKKYRPIVRWAIESGFRPSIYGTRWSDLVPQDLIKGENIDNKALARAYASAKVVLNDHWESMREYGFISNRIFDVLASGARLVSDAMPSIGYVFGGAVTQVRGPEELRGRTECRSVGSALQMMTGSGSRPGCSRIIVSMPERSQ